MKRKNWFFWNMWTYNKNRFKQIRSQCASVVSEQKWWTVFSVHARENDFFVFIESCNALNSKRICDSKSFQINTYTEEEKKTVEYSRN